MANNDKWKKCTDLQVQKNREWRKSHNQGPKHHSKEEPASENKEQDNGKELLSHLQPGSSQVQVGRQLHERCSSESTVTTDRNQSSCSRGARSVQQSDSRNNEGSKVKLTTKEKIRKKWRDLSLLSFKLKLFRRSKRKSSADRLKSRKRSPHRPPSLLDRRECCADFDRSPCPEDPLQMCQAKVVTQEKQMDSLDDQEHEREGTSDVNSLANESKSEEGTNSLKPLEDQRKYGEYIALFDIPEDLELLRACTAHLHSLEHQKSSGECTDHFGNLEVHELMGACGANHDSLDDQKLPGECSDPIRKPEDLGLRRDLDAHHDSLNDQKLPLDNPEDQELSAPRTIHHDPIRDQDLSEGLTDHTDNAEDQKMSKVYPDHLHCLEVQQSCGDSTDHLGNPEDVRLSNASTAHHDFLEGQEPSGEKTSHLDSDDDLSLSEESNEYFDAMEDLEQSGEWAPSLSCGPVQEPAHPMDNESENYSETPTLAEASAFCTLSPITMVSDVSVMAQNVGSFTGNLADSGRTVSKWVNHTSAGELSNNKLTPAIGKGQDASAGGPSNCQPSSSHEYFYGLANKSPNDCSGLSDHAYVNLDSGNPAQSSSFSRNWLRDPSNTEEIFPFSHGLKSSQGSGYEHGIHSSMKISPYQSQTPGRKTRKLSSPVFHSRAQCRSFESPHPFGKSGSLTDRDLSSDEDDEAKRSLESSYNVSQPRLQCKTTQTSPTFSPSPKVVAESSDLGASARQVPETKSRPSLWSYLKSLKDYYFSNSGRDTDEEELLEPGIAARRVIFSHPWATRMGGVYIHPLSVVPPEVLDRSFPFRRPETDQMSDTSADTEETRRTEDDDSSPPRSIMKPRRPFNVPVISRKRCHFYKKVEVRKFSDEKNCFLPDVYQVPLSTGESDEEESDTVGLYYRIMERAQEEMKLDENDYAKMKATSDSREDEDPSSARSGEDTNPIKVDGATVYFSEADFLELLRKDREEANDSAGDADHNADVASNASGCRGSTSQRDCQPNTPKEE